MCRGVKGIVADVARATEAGIFIGISLRYLVKHGPRSCPLYRSGPERKVSGSHGMIYK